jgi:activating signal cointegrator complex subunit 3
MQRRTVLQQMQRNILPLWNEVKEALKDNCKLLSITSDKELNDLLRQMLDIGREFVGFGSTMDLVESSAVFVLQVFHDSKYVKQILGVTSLIVNEFENMFGSEVVNNSLVNKAYEHSKQILELLDVDERERLFMPFNTNRKAFNYQKFNDKQINFLNIINSNNNVEEKEWGEEYKDIDIDPFADNQQIIVTWDSIMDQNDVQDSNKGFALSFEYKDSNSYNSKSQNSSHFPLNSTKNEYNIEWLNIELTKYIDKYNDEHNEPFYMNIENLIETVINEIQIKTKSNEELASDLNNLLGDISFSLIEKIVKYRKPILESYKQIYEEEVSHEQNMREKVKSTHSNTAFRDKRPALLQSVVVHTTEEKNLKKQIRKIEKKMNKEFNKDMEVSNNSISLEDIERMKQEREQALIRAMYGPLFKEENREVLDRSEYPYVFDSYAEAKSTPAFISGAKMILPSGFIRNDQRRWEEITIPAPPPPPEVIIDNYKLIDVEQQLDEFGKIGFRGVKTLNRIQSIVYKTAYKTRENMLICAPTGAGKTNVAMLTILNEIKLHSRGVDDIDLSSFKIVYIAPMKALAAEMTENFSKKLAPLGIQVRELTGDMQMTKSEIMNTQIIVTTPEKWDVVTRKSKGDVQLLQLVKLIIIDEVHLLQSDRGPVLEALVARTVRYVESAQRSIRLVGLSATLPNYKDVAVFLHVNHKVGLFVFDNRFRPVPLSQTFIGCKATQTMQQMHDMDEVTYEKVHEMVAKGHQVMVFVHARNSTIRTATILRDKANKNGHLNVFKCDCDRLIGSEQMMRKVRHKHLSELFEGGFAIHHAGMLRKDRNIVEKLFRGGVVKVLVCTATLAWGVNLPAHSVCYSNLYYIFMFLF